jgi:hypothetical protein
MFVFMMLVYHGEFREPGEAHAGRARKERAMLRHAGFISRANRAARRQDVTGVGVEMPAK